MLYDTVEDVLHLAMNQRRRLRLCCEPDESDTEAYGFSYL